jgi:hypothetical protein
MRTLAFGSLAVLGLCGTVAEAGGGPSWSIGVRIGAPVYPRPYYYYGPPYYYRPYPVYVEPAPVVVRPVEVVQPVYQVPATAPAGTQAPAPTPAGTQAPAVAATQAVPVSTQAPASDERSGDVERNLQLLADANENVRANAVLQLGRLRAVRAIDPLAATLTGDASPSVRETAARALGLIGSPKAMPALQRAAQLDSDRDVRHSAQFAIEVIQNNRGN